MTIHHTKRHNNASMRRALASIAAMQANQYNVVMETVETLTHTRPEDSETASNTANTTYSVDGNRYDFSN